ncbi:MotA/TolQ/ExbB proton channel family protein, partial [Oleiphilus sp. HI0066]|uniref:MotA/TolQ/ExbB proton channel family protein n=2 Tax=Oleiphilus TaxID=141450 RepID=UPI000B13C269
FKHQLRLHLWILRGLVMICPLLGLLGTVTGMISVFDVMAYSGTGNARSMAAGISKATIPTMAGMTVAIVGLLLIARIDRLARSRQEALTAQLSVS